MKGTSILFIIVVILATVWFALHEQRVPAERQQFITHAISATLDAYNARHHSRVPQPTVSFDYEGGSVASHLFGHIAFSAHYAANGSTADLERTISHELAHHIFGHRFGTFVPGHADDGHPIFVNTASELRVLIITVRP